MWQRDRNARAHCTTSLREQRLTRKRAAGWKFNPRLDVNLGVRPSQAMKASARQLSMEPPGPCEPGKLRLSPGSSVREHRRSVRCNDDSPASGVLLPYRTDSAT